MSLIPPYKIADCSECGDKQVPCVKVAKDYFCKFKCHARNKMKQQVAKSNQRSAVRGLLQYQKVEGVMDSIQELTIDLDRVISRYIRIRDMEMDGKITCYCCDKRVKWENSHAMHYINRQHMGARFLLENLRSGCAECNVEKRGNLVVYAERLNKETPGIVDWLNDQSHTVVSPTRDELKQLLFDMQQRLKMVETKLKK